MLGMHAMTFRILRPDRQEGAGPDVKRYEMLGNAVIGERAEQPAGEMKPGGRRGDRALLAREHRLVIAAVLRVGVTARRDVRRERHIPQAVDRLVESGADEIEDERRFAFVPARGDGCGEAGGETRLVSCAEPDAVAGFEPFRRTCQSLPAIGPESFDQRDRDLGFSLIAPPHAVELGGDDLGIVEDERIAGRKQRRQIEHHPVGDRGRGPRLDEEEPGGVARDRGA